MNGTALTTLKDIRPLKLVTKGSEENGSGEATHKIDILSLRIVDSDSDSGSGVVWNTMRLQKSWNHEGNLVFNCDAGTLAMKSGDEAALKASFHFHLPFGQMEVQDMDVNSHTKAQSIVNEWLSEGGLQGNSTLWKEVQKAQLPLKSAIFTPGFKLEQVPEMLLLQLITFTLKNSLKVFTESDLSYDELIDSTRTFIKITEGLPYNAESKDNAAFPNFSLLCSLFLKFREMILVKGHDVGNGLVRDLTEFVEINTWDAEKWWEDCGSHKGNPLSFYHFRHELNNGMKVYIELLALLQGIHLKEKVRRDPLFALIKTQWVRTCVLIESILSAPTSLKDGTENLVLVRAMKKNAAYAVNKTINDLKGGVKYLNSFYSQLGIKFGENTPHYKDLQNYFQVGKKLMDANLQYLIGSKKFGDIDLEVELRSF